ncbi:MAG: FAD-binding and (Fe-S)-binding domain-containing protein [Verrucomicrobiota bacterium]
MLAITSNLKAKINPTHRPDAVNSAPNVDALALEKELRATVRGEVRFSDGDRALYSTDSSNYRQIPIGVVIPQDRRDIVATAAACRKFGAPITCRGGGTSLAGQCCNVAVVIDFTKYYNRILEVDVERKLVRVEPGIVLDSLNQAMREHGLIFGPDPATHNRCAIGGMLGNNSCGVHSVMAEFYGGGARASDNVESLEVLLYDGTILKVGRTSESELEQKIERGGRTGEIYAKLKELRDRYGELVRERFPKIPRRVSGYNLDELLPEHDFDVARALVGSEGTCVIILEATLQLIENPPCRSLVVLGYPDIYHAGDQVPEIRKYKPVGLEGVDDVLINAMKLKHIHPRDLALLPEGKGWLIVEFGGNSTEEADAQAKRLMDGLNSQWNPPSMKLIDDRVEEAVIWEIRDSGLGASARVPNEPDTWEGWEDSAVSPHDIGNYLRDFRALLDKHGYLCTLYGHFGQGLVHTRIDFGLKTHDGVKEYLAFTNEAADLVVHYGGSLSGEHGDGQSRGELLVKMFGPELVDAFQEFKAIWDPAWKLNPGKVVRPFRRDENLRYGEHYDPPQWPTHFAFPEDGGSFSFALERCVGVGQCRRHEGGTMCPSYMVTREEEHSTRGRARRLWEMLQGQVIGKNGWRDDSVLEALDLCLACKGCKADCPVNVDMATYKAEFYSHYYAGRLRPRSAYAMGLIYWWARLASIAPNIVNFFTQTPPFSWMAKALGGIAPQRRIPKFAKETFREWFARRSVVNPHGSRVILWADTFNNHFFPEAAKAAVEVLEDAGFHVVVQRKSLCCGRPLYDFGMLTTATHLLRQILDTLREEIELGTPVVGLEPSCVAVFRDELVGLFPTDENAKRLSGNTMMLAEFLEKHAPEYQPPKLNRKVVLHGHCHDKAIMKMAGEESLLRKMGLDVELLDSGCCGMAGSFGFEREHYDVSEKCGERVLLPAVRTAPKDALIVTDGFSCHEQIEQLTGRKPLHIAQVIQMALRENRRGAAERHLEAPPAIRLREVALFAGVVAVVVYVVRRIRSR